MNIYGPNPYHSLGTGREAIRSRKLSYNQTPVFEGLTSGGGHRLSRGVCTGSGRGSRLSAGASGSCEPLAELQQRALLGRGVDGATPQHFLAPEMCPGCQNSHLCSLDVYKI